MSRDWLLYLDDLIEGAEKVQRYLKGRSADDFASDEMLFDAVLFNLQVIGEAVKRLPDEAKAAAPEGDWSGPARMRDLIAHHYFAIEPQIVWEAATLHVPRRTRRPLRGKKDKRLSWEETYRETAREKEDWSDLDALAAPV